MSKNRMKELRKINRFSQRDVADYLKVTRQAVQSYEVGRNEPNLETCEKLAKLYGVTPAYLVGWED